MVCANRHPNIVVRTRWLLIPVLLLVAGPAIAANKPQANPKAVQAVENGKRTQANAAWWGFDAKDSTDSLQAAIDSGAKKITVPDMGKPWLVRPIELASDQTLIFEKGVVVEAKPGAYRAKHDSLFTARHVNNLTIRGQGAIWKMHKKDYQKAPYKESEWRHGLRLHGCRNINIEGLTIRSSGGDGIYVGRGKGQGHIACRNIRISHVKCLDNHRQGISVITAKGLVIEQCVLRGTSGTAPQAGIDFEPNNADEPLTDCHVRDCLIEKNAGRGVLIYLGNLNKTSEPVDITVEANTIDKNKGQSVSVMYRGNVPGKKSRLHFKDNKIAGRIMVAKQGDASGGRFRVDIDR